MIFDQAHGVIGEGAQLKQQSAAITSQMKDFIVEAEKTFEKGGEGHLKVLQNFMYAKELSLDILAEQQLDELTQDWVGLGGDSYHIQKKQLWSG